MSQALALQKLARAAKLSAEAAKLYAEAASELETAEIKPPPTLPPPTEWDQARAVRALRKAGVRI